MIEQLTITACCLLEENAIDFANHGHGFGHAMGILLKFLPDIYSPNKIKNIIYEVYFFFFFKLSHWRFNPVHFLFDCVLRAVQCVGLLCTLCAIFASCTPTQ